MIVLFGGDLKFGWFGFVQARGWGSVDVELGSRNYDEFYDMFRGVSEW